MKFTIKPIPICLLAIFFLSLFSGLSAQELRDAAATKGIKFGSPLMHMYDNSHRQLYSDQLNFASIIVLWKETHNNEGYYFWDRADDTRNFARDRGWEMMGTALSWGDDNHIPDWVKTKPYNQAEQILNSHIDAVMYRYRNDFDAWVVVNEAMTYNGQYRNCYWNKALTGEYIAKAFKRAQYIDPTADLIYNDYDIEKYEQKFNAMKDMIVYVRSLGGKVDGVGWQLHVKVDDVLSPSFPLANRMQQLSNMNLKNYVTELDIAINANTPAEWEKQRRAYKKIVEIFLNNPTHSESFQTWGITDKYSWIANPNDGYRPWPLPFNRFYEKKPGYWGMVEAFSADGGDPTNSLLGETRIKNVWSNTYLHQLGAYSGGAVTVQNLQPTWYSQRWNIEQGPDDSYRIKCSWLGNYLNNAGNYNDAPVNVYALNNGWWSQHWYIENASNNIYRLRNRWTGKYLHTGNQYNVTTYDGNPNWGSQLWAFEYINSSTKDATIPVDMKISPNPAADYIQLTEFNENTEYLIYDTSGRVVLQGKGVMIDINQLTSGSYLLTAFPQDEEFKGSFGRAIFVKN